tara:strand:+ start:1136 stop:2287 length:1152 start_codon:yes stop_codon:yes gene_type:complete
MISYGRQYVDNNDIKAVVKVLKGDWLTQGPQVKRFEKLLNSKFGSKYCTALSSGTAALHLVAIALGWKKGDIILTTPISFLATSNSILHCHATPVFIDIDKNSFNIDVNKLEKVIVSYQKKGKKISGIIATDFAGQPCDWKSIKNIADKYNIITVNDNCHAIGASINNNKKYAIKYADVVVHSYHPVKNITSGEGGAVFTNNKLIDQRVKMLRSQGIKRFPSKAPWYYEMVELGYNFRISDIHCALGISQLKKLELFVKKRKLIAKKYDFAFKNIKNLKIPKILHNVSHAYHLYPVRINFKKFDINKNLFFKNLKKRKINLQVHYIPIHLQPYYKKKFKFRKGDFPVAENFYEEQVSLPIYYSLKNKEVNYIIKQIKNLLKIN